MKDSKTRRLIAASVVTGVAAIWAMRLIAQPKSMAYDITKEQFEAMLASGTDDSLRIVDQGKYLIGVGMNRRGRLDASARGVLGNAINTGQGRGTQSQGRGTQGQGRGSGGAANPPAPANCGTPGTPSPNAISGLAHTVAAETYVITSGSATLVTGGHIVNGRKSDPASALETIQNGPSCSGMIDGPDVVRRTVKAGDAIIIPANTPHGWAEIPDHIAYVSIRTDPDKVMTNNFVHPVIQKMQANR